MGFGLFVGIMKDVQHFLMAAVYGSHEFVRMHAIVSKSDQMVTAWNNNWPNTPRKGDLFVITMMMPIITPGCFDEMNNLTATTTREFTQLSQRTQAPSMFAKADCVGVVLSDPKVIFSSQVVFTNECATHDFCNRTSSFVSVLVGDLVGIIDVQTLVSKSQLIV